MEERYILNCLVCGEKGLFKLTSTYNSYYSFCDNCSTTIYVPRRSFEAYTRSLIVNLEFDVELGFDQFENSNFQEIKYEDSLDCFICDGRTFIKKCKAKKQKKLKRGQTRRNMGWLYKKQGYIKCYKCHYVIFIKAGYFASTIEKIKLFGVKLEHADCEKPVK